MDHYGVRARLQMALTAWLQAREAEGNAGRIKTGLAYQRAVNHLQLYVTLLRDGRNAPGEFADELPAACHALSILCREAVPKVLASGAPRYAAVQARIALAAAHLADPADGQRSQIASALDGPVLERFDPDGVGDVSADERISGAADVRMMLAQLAVRHPPASGARGTPWPITTDCGAGALAVYRDRRNFRRAVLPSCVGMAAESEAMQLAKEAVQLYTELARLRPEHAGQRDRTVAEFHALARQLEITAPMVD